MYEYEKKLSHCTQVKILFTPVPAFAPDAVHHWQLASKCFPGGNVALKLVAPCAVLK